ncbi:MAG: DUF370 domain-containing protein [Clostridiales bacterium]|nr:DUF370 domain-containing protein [Clostridiales bacterium]
MYIHIGGEYVVSERLILVIIDLNHVYPHQADMKRFMITQEESGCMEYIGEDLPQSLIVTMERSYVSPLSVQTLFRRMNKARSGC